MDIFNYFKEWISGALYTTKSRKRRSIFDEDDYFTSRKIPKMSSFEEKCSTPNKRSSCNINKSRPSWSKENLTINVDDEDDDVIEVKQYKFQNGNRALKKRNTSTPKDPSVKPVFNGDDDITFVSCQNLSNSRTGAIRKQSFDGNKLNDNGLSKMQARNSQLFSSVLSSNNEIKMTPTTARKSIHNNALNQTYRLDEKEKYKELLERIAPNSTVRSSFSLPLSKYMNVGRMFIQGNGSDRTKYLLSASRRLPKEKRTQFVDLTTSTVNGNGRRLSTKDRIKKVLDQYDNDLIVLKDSDSDSVEILPTPPTPEPDFKIERINSLEHIVNILEPAQTSWLTDSTKKHRDRLAQREKDIEQYKNYTQKLHEINRDIQIKTLDAKLKNCLHIKDLVIPIDLSEEEAKLPPLTDEQKDIVCVAFNRRASPDEVLAEKFNLRITRRDIMTLSGLSWLNDEVINFYMNLIIERGKDAKWPNVYAMNTFFYPKLLKDGPASLRRWTRRVDIFAHDLLVVPIHLGMHWCMAIIDFKDKAIRYYDSMGGNNRRCLEALRDYLVAEHKDKKQAPYDVSDWKLVNVKDIPQQMNGSDCGMFSCTFAEFLARNAKITFSQDDMPYLREKMVVEIITGKLLIS